MCAKRHPTGSDILLYKVGRVVILKSKVITMGLDIRFTAGRNIICPHCGEVVGQTYVRSVDAGGRGWYTLLESLGYYVPYEQRTGTNDWYGKDMVLTPEQVKEAYYFATDQNLYEGASVYSLLADAMEEGLNVVVNADW